VDLPDCFRGPAGGKIAAAMLAGGLLTLAGTILITSADKTPAE
jgi:hypothetical protein